MNNYNYQYTEELMQRLLNLLLGEFTDSERNEVQEFIDVGEYGLALQTFVDIVIEENRRISSKASEIIIELSELMQLDSNIFSERLRDNIIND